MDIQKLAEEGRIDEIEQQLMDLDSEFRFKCRKCGKCCKHQDTILFSARDVFNIAKKLGKSPKDVINEYAETYIGGASRIPVVHMAPRGPSAVCPFLEDGRCSIHDSKPTVCALFPLGRVIINPAEEVDEGLPADKQPVVRYMLNDIDCGSRKRVNTVRSWLERFNIPEQDEFFLLWSQVATKLVAAIRSIEDHQAPPDMMDSIWDQILAALYLDYDTTEDFMPQFQRNAEKLLSLARDLESLVEFLRSNAPLIEED